MPARRYLGPWHGPKLMDVRRKGLQSDAEWRLPSDYQRNRR